MYTRWTSQVAKFQSNEEGAIAIIFGLMLTTMVFLAGVALDYSRITDGRARMSQAIDAASLAAGRALLDGKLNDGEIEVMAATFIEQDLKGLKSSAKVSKPVIKVDRQNGEIDIDMNADIGMTLTTRSASQASSRSTCRLRR